MGIAENSTIYFVLLLLNRENVMTAEKMKTAGYNITPKWNE